MAVTSALAYSIMATINAVKSFTVQAFGLMLAVNAKSLHLKQFSCTNTLAYLYEASVRKKKVL
jgi:hypothetical protein